MIFTFFLSTASKFSSKRDYFFFTFFTFLLKSKKKKYRKVEKSKRYIFLMQYCPPLSHALLSLNYRHLRPWIPVAEPGTTLSLHLSCSLPRTCDATAKNDEIWGAGPTGLHPQGL